MMCCNQMGDKQKIQGVIYDLKTLVKNAYLEGMSNGARHGYATTFQNSTTKETLDKINTEVL